MAEGLPACGGGGFCGVLYGLQLFLLSAGVLYAFRVFAVGGGGVSLAERGAAGLKYPLVFITKIC